MATQKVRFGFTLSNRGMMFGAATPSQLLEAGVRAEESGLFEGLFAGDSLFARPRLEALALLNALAACTRTVKLGTGCMASFALRDPRVFAYEWASLDQLSGGRALLVVCSGITSGGAGVQEGKLFGLTNRQRVRKLVENVAILRRLWSEDDVTFQGEFTSFENLTLEPKPVQQPCPIWIAANPGGFDNDPKAMERPLRRVAELADGWMTLNRAPNSFAVRWSLLERFLREAGRDPDTFPTCAYHNVNVNPDVDEGLAESKRFLDLYYGPIFNLESVRAWTALGTPKQCVEHLRALRDQGARLITLRITAWKQQEQLERLIGDVLPYVDD